MKTLIACLVLVASLVFAPSAEAGHRGRAAIIVRPRFFAARAAIVVQPFRRQVIVAQPFVQQQFVQPFYGQQQFVQPFVQSYGVQQFGYGQQFIGGGYGVQSFSSGGCYTGF